MPSGLLMGEHADEATRAGARARGDVTDRDDRSASAGLWRRPPTAPVRRQDTMRRRVLDLLVLQENQVAAPACAGYQGASPPGGPSRVSVHSILRGRVEQPLVSRHGAPCMTLREQGHCVIVGSPPCLPAVTFLQHTLQLA